MPLRAQDIAKVYALLSGFLPRFVFVAFLMYGTGGCVAVQGRVAEENSVESEVCEAPQASAMYGGVFHSQDQCDEAVGIYREFLYKFLGAHYAEQVLDSGEPLCANADGGQKQDDVLVHYICAQACMYLKQNNNPQALLCVARALELNPTFIPAQLIRAEIAAAQDKVPEAISRLERIFVAHPYLNRLHLRMNALHMQQNDYVGAARDLQRYLYVEPDAQAVLLQLGRIQAQQKDFAAATKTLQTLIDLAPLEPVAYFELGQVLEQQSRYGRALNLYRTAAHTLEHSVQEFEFLQAELLLEQNEYAAAADVLRSSLTREDSVPLRLLYGYALLQMGEYTAAVPELRAAAEALEFNSMAWLWLGQALEHQKHWYDAIAAFQQVEEGAVHTGALLHLAGLYHMVDYNLDAIKAFDDLLARGLSDPILYQQLSNLHIQEHNYPDAVSALGQGIEKHPDNVELKYRLGLLYAMTGDYSAALEWMQQVERLRPDDPEVLNNLAYLYAETETNLEHAVTLVQTALEHESRAEFHDTLGWIYFKLGRYTAALNHLLRARDMRPPDAQILQHLGDVYAAVGQMAQAADAYAKSLEIDRDNIYLHNRLNLDCED